MTLFDGRRALWVHQRDQLGEATIEDVAATAMTYAKADIILVKALDGQSWMSRFDTHLEAISGLKQLWAMEQRATAAGVTLIPWTVPNNAGDAALHATLGDTVVIDLEPYAQFWVDNSADVLVYLQGLRAGGVKNLFVSIDPRKSAEDALDVAAWAHLVDAILPQTYWTDFQSPASACVPMITALQTTVAPGVPIYPALPYNAAPGDLTAFWEALGGTCQSASLWRMGTADGTQLKAFGALTMPTPVPVPVDPCADNIAKLAAAMAKVMAITAALPMIEAAYDTLIADVQGLGQKLDALRTLLTADN